MFSVKRNNLQPCGSNVPWDRFPCWFQAGPSELQLVKVIVKVIVQWRLIKSKEQNG